VISDELEPKFIAMHEEYPDVEFRVNHEPDITINPRDIPQFRFMVDDKEVMRISGWMSPQTLKHAIDNAFKPMEYVPANQTNITTTKEVQ